MPAPYAATINQFLGIVIEDHLARYGRVGEAVVLFRPIFGINRDHGRLVYPPDATDTPIAVAHSAAALHFAAAVRARHPSVAAWTRYERHQSPDGHGWSELIGINVSAMPVGARLADALRATKSVAPFSIKVRL